MWSVGGKFDNGNYFLIRSPLESIRESADISNKFYFFVGIIIIVISGMCIMAVTRRLTKTDFRADGADQQDDKS